MENFKEQGQYPVVFLSLKDLKADNWESMANYLKVLISNLCLENKYLLKNLDSFDKDLFESYINKNAKTESL